MELIQHSQAKWTFFIGGGIWLKQTTQSTKSALELIQQSQANEHSLSIEGYGVNEIMTKMILQKMLVV